MIITRFKKSKIGNIGTVKRNNCRGQLPFERITGFALSGNPPAPITQELRELLDIARINTMTTSPMEKFQQLPQNLQQEVAHFIDFLVLRHGTSVGQ